MIFGNDKIICIDGGRYIRMAQLGRITNKMRDKLSNLHIHELNNAIDEVCDELSEECLKDCARKLINNKAV